MNTKRKWKTAALLAIVIAGAAMFYFYRLRATDTVSYREIPVRRGDIEVSILSTGTVQPENRLEIKPPVAGRVERVLAAEGQYVHKGDILAWMSSTERAALIDAARAQGAAEVKRWEELYRATPIMAPINGTIIQRNVEAGQTFTGTDAVFVMSDRLTVKAQVDETDIAQIHVKQKADLVLDAYPDESIGAHVDLIAYDAKTVNNVTTYIVDVLPDKTPKFMRSGMTANVTFSVAAHDNVVTVPNEALKVVDDAHYVLVKAPDTGAALKRAIKIGITDGKRTEVLEGLHEGETLLIANTNAHGKRGGSGNPFSPFGNRKGGH